VTPGIRGNFESDYQLHPIGTMRQVLVGILPLLLGPLLLGPLLLGTLPALAAEPAPIAIGIRDHQFVPAVVPVPVGVKVELKVRNEQTVPAEFESTSLHREKVVTPGATISVYIGPLAAGTYEFFDDFHPATRGNVVAR
jgi:hypothetical protein